MALLRICRLKLLKPKPSIIQYSYGSSGPSTTVKNLGAIVSNRDLKEEIVEKLYMIDIKYKELLLDYDEATVDWKQIVRTAARYVVECDIYKEKLYSFKPQQEALWRATARAAMDNFETLYGSRAVIDRSQFPPDITFDERTKRVRFQRMLWILINKPNEWKVKRLSDMINESPYYSEKVKIDKTGQKIIDSPYEQFSESYAIAYFELSEDLKRRLLHPGVGDFEFKGLTTDPQSNLALNIFMGLFEFSSEVVIPKIRDEGKNIPDV